MVHIPVDGGGWEGSENHWQFHRLNFPFLSCHFSYLSFYASGVLDLQAIIYVIFNDEKNGFGPKHSTSQKADHLLPLSEVDFEGGLVSLSDQGSSQALCLF